MTHSLVSFAIKSVIEFLNLPIKLFEMIIDGIDLQYTHMENVCTYIAGLIGYQYNLATFENTRFALQELACRAPFTLDLQRGYGCEYARLVHF